MIDVMFFLLVTFMLASLSMQSLDALAINLPQGEAAKLTNKEPVTLTVTRDSKIYLDKTPATLGNMAQMLTPMLRGREPGLIVAADDLAPQGVVVEAMLQARRVGVEHFLIAVKHE